MASETQRPSVYMPNSRVIWGFSATAILQAIICLALEGYVFGSFQTDLKDSHARGLSQSKAITVYLALFIFGFLYQMLLVYWALKARNTIQIIMLCVYNGAMLIYSAVQADQIKDAATALSQQGQFNNADLWSNINAYLITVPCVLALGTVLMCGFAWKLHDEFAWTIYKNVSADIRLKRRFFVYQVYVALLQLDFFFFIGFSVQFLVVVTGTSLVEEILTIIALALSVVVLILAYFITKHEVFSGMVVVIILYFAALAYFLAKLFRMYEGPDERVQQYLPVRKSLTIFAILTIILLLATIFNAIWAIINFNKGLKPVLTRPKRLPDADDKLGYEHDINMAASRPAGIGTAPTRMTID